MSLSGAPNQWPGRRGRPRAGEPSRRKRRPRPQVEALEARCVPATITVTSLNDFDPMMAHVGVTLRDAIQAANTNTSVNGSTAGDPGADTVTFAAGLSGTIPLSQDQLTISEPLTIRAPAPITIDAQGNSVLLIPRIFDITDTAGDVTLDGLTLINGKTTGNRDPMHPFTNHGGAIYSASHGTLTISNCTLSGNKTMGTGVGGGAVFTLDGAVAVTASTLTGNSAQYRGGAIYSNNGAVTVTNSTLSGNSSQGTNANGGGIFSAYGPVTLTNSVLASNTANGDTAKGGGLFVRGPAPNPNGPPPPPLAVTVTNSTISDNSTQGPHSNGGGLYVRRNALVTVTNSTVSGNSTAQVDSSGGGIALATNLRPGDVPPALVVTDSTISGNHTTGDESPGGGIATVSGALTVTSSTVAGNSALGLSPTGGIAFGAALTLLSSIVAGNSGRSSPDVGPLIAGTSGPLVVSDSLIGTSDGTGLSPTTMRDANGKLIADAGGNLIGIDPMLEPLANNGGRIYTMALSPLSPAIDRGGPPGTLTSDQRGFPFVRSSGAAPDMGAYELQPPPTLVVTSAADRLDPTFDPNDLTLRDAVQLADDYAGGETISFAPGLSGVPIPLSHGELDLTQPVTIQGLGANNTTIDAQHNSRIFGVGPLAGDVTLDGLTLTGGQAPGTEGGGAIRSLSSGTLTVQNSTLTGNTSQGGGGAILAWYGRVAVLNSTLSDNHALAAQSPGGGIYARQGAIVTVTNSTVNDNSAPGGGGGIASNGFFVTVINSTIYHNSTAGTGGGLFEFHNGPLAVFNSTVAGNISTAADVPGVGPGVGGIFSDGSTALRSSIVAGNSDTASGGMADLFVPLPQNLAITNTLIRDGTGTGLNPTGPTTPDANGNLIGTALNPIEPMLGQLGDNHGPTKTLALPMNSPAIDRGANPLGLGTDQRGPGFPREFNGQTDMGAFEFKPPGFSRRPRQFDSAAASAAGGAYFVAAGDFNGDGKPDLAVANGTGSGTVSVLLGNGDGTFQAPEKLAVGASPTALAVADLRGDGKQDLVVVDGATTVSVLLGNGDGTFQPPQPFAAGNEPASVVVGDFNGDHIPDLAVADSADGTVSVLLGNGDGTFQKPHAFAAGLNPDVVVAGDFSGDGKLDLAVAGHNSNTISVLLGNGDGTFQMPQQTAPVGFDTHALAVGDLNGDGKPDIAVTNQQAGTVSVLLANGDGTFGKPQTFAVDNGPTAVAIGDFNGDGKPDLAVTNDGNTNARGSYNTVSVLLGNGDGTFRPQQAFATGVTPVSVAVTDLDGDGTPDLAVANYHDGTVSALLGNGDGTFQAARTFAAGREPSAVAAGDFNADGKPDLAVANVHDDTVSVLLGNGDGTFGPQKTFAVDGSPQSVAVADFNGDGRPDLVTANQTGHTVSVLLGNGDGTFQPQQTFAVGVNPSYVAVGDFNRDGKLDLAVANAADNTVSVLLGNGDGTFRPQQTFAAGTDPVWVAVGDVNGDGIPDLVVADHFDSTVSVLLGNGDGTFQAPHAVAAGLSATAVAVADLNGDGRPDLAVASSGAGDDMIVLLGNGDGTFQAPHSFGAGQGANALAVADFNGDGKPDLAVTDSIGDAVRVFLGNGDGTFQAAQSFAMAYVPNSLAVADLNGDGRPDLAVANLASENVGVLLNREPRTTTTVVTSKANPTSFGDSTTFSAVVTGAGGGPAPTGTVTFQDGVRILAAGVPLVNGEADYTTTDLTPGAHTITATYSGDDSDTGSSGTVVQQVNRLSSSVALTQSGAPTQVGQPVTFTATVSGAGPTPTGTVTFRDGPVVLADGVALDQGGVATFSTTALGGGSHAITAVYGGDRTHAFSTSPAVTVQISPTTATVTVTTSGSPSGVGDPVTFTATVSGAGPTPTGTVTFLDGTTPLVADVGICSHVCPDASFTTTALAVGSHAITAVYSGDGNYTASTSAPLTQQVNPAPSTTTLTSSGSPSQVGQSVTFTATVKGAGPRPTGTVTFRDGTAVLAANVALDQSGAASFSTGSLAVGEHGITAVYGGDGTYAASTSVPASVTVLAPTPPPPGPQGPVSVVLGSRPVGPRRKLVALVRSADGSLRALLSPFQKPLYGSIAAALADLDGDGIFDAVVFSARRGKRRVSRTIRL
jgi:hypothetical protein